MPITYYPEDKADLADMARNVKQFHKADSDQVKLANYAEALTAYLDEQSPDWELDFRKNFLVTELHNI